MSVTLDSQTWLATSLGKTEHSPLTADSYEMGQAEVQVRHELSTATGAARQSNFARLQRALLSAEIVERMSTGESAAARKLIGGRVLPRLYDAGNALDAPSSARAAILDILAGKESEESPAYAARELVQNTSQAERPTVIAQLEAALKGFDKAMARLPKLEVDGAVDGTYSQSAAQSLRQTLALSLARLRQPAVAAALDTLTDKTDLPSQYATFADVGVRHDVFAALRQAVSTALAHRDPNAVSDISRLWRSTKEEMGEDVDLWNPGSGFGRIHYADQRHGESFQHDVHRLESELGKMRSFRVFGGRPV